MASVLRDDASLLPPPHTLHLLPVINRCNMPKGAGANKDRQERPTRRLEGVSLELKGERPKARLKLVITTDLKELIEYEVGKSGPIRWIGKCACQSRISIQLYKKTPSGIEFISSAVILLPPDEHETETMHGGVIQFDTMATDTAHYFHHAEEWAEIMLSFSDIRPGGVGSERTAINAARQTAEEQCVLLDFLDRMEHIRGYLKSVEETGDMVKEIHPYIESVCNAIFLLYKACEKEEKCRKAARALVEEMDDFLSLEFEEIGFELKEQKETRKMFSEFAELITQTFNYIISSNKNMMSKYFLRDHVLLKYEAGLEEYLTELRVAGKMFRDCIIGFGIWDIVEDEELRRKFNAMPKAHYDSRRCCLTGTRKGLLRSVMRWVRDPESPKTRWVYGVAGSGKSAVANSVAAMLNEQKIPLTCFLCSRDDPELSDARRVLPTIAYRFSQYHDDYRVTMTESMHGATSLAIEKCDIKEQSDLLFGESFAKLAGQDGRRPRFHVLVIDALDECGSDSERKALSECLLQMANTIPWVKLFITSRPEPGIRDIFAAPDSRALSVDINAEPKTGANIRLFIKTRSRGLGLVLSHSEITILTQQASGLFIWCTTVFKHISESPNREADFQKLITGNPPVEVLRQIHSLYEEILAAAIPQDPSEDRTLMITILGVLYITKNAQPLSINAISDFLRRKGEDREEKRRQIQNAVRALHAVLYEDPRMSSAVRACHPSFLSFIEGKIRSGLWLTMNELHQLMFRGALAMMHDEHRGLRFNICGLGTSYRLNKNIPDLADRISTFIPKALRYSSLFWFTHLVQSNLPASSEEVLSMVSELLKSPKALFWLEVLSVLGAVGRGIVLLRECAAFFANDEHISSVASGLERFVMSYAEAMESVPHIYLSALSWLPEKAELHSVVASLFKHLPVVAHKENNWEGARRVENVGSQVRSVAYSPDGRYFASGLDDFTVRIFNAHTCEPVGQLLEGNLSPVSSVTFSPDSQWIASGSFDGNVRIWDIEGGSVMKTFKGQSSNWITSVSFSPDRQRIASGSYDQTIRLWDVKTSSPVGYPLTGGGGGSGGSIAFSADGEQFVSGSVDNTVRIWNAHTGTQIGEPLSGHSDTVRSVAYSRNGVMIASGSSDSTVRIWNARTGALTRVLTGHTNYVQSVCFSLDDKHIASGSSDGSICVWNVETGSFVRKLLIGHSGYVSSMAFSVDGRSILSGSYDRTLRIWDIQSSAIVDNTLSGHFNPVLCVTNSPSGRYIASGSHDKTVCIWDALTGEAVGEPLRGHSRSINSVAFSNDGQWLVSASTDRSLLIWDTATWSVSGDPILGHTDSVLSVAVSSNDRLIASGSEDNTVRLWGMETREVVRVLKGHTGCVASVSFFPDGQRVASGAHDRTIRIWDTQTGNAVGQPLQGHSYSVHVVAVSPNGHLIASGSTDQTVRLWNAKTRQTLHVLKGHSSNVSTVNFSPDGQHFVSGSGDGTIRVWNVEKGEAVGEPLRGHSGWVRSVAFSPDGQRIVSSADDRIIRVWDAQTLILRDSLDDKCRARWNTCRARMEVEDGWVKDGDKLLLWVPMQYRYDSMSGFGLAIGEGMRRRRPEVDAERLFAYSGTQWTDIYDPTAGIDTQRVS